MSEPKQLADDRLKAISDRCSRLKYEGGKGAKEYGFIITLFVEDVNALLVEVAALEAENAALKKRLEPDAKQGFVLRWCCAGMSQDFLIGNAFITINGIERLRDGATRSDVLINCFHCNAPIQITGGDDGK